MSERDDLTEQAFHTPEPPSLEVLRAAKKAGLKRGDSFTYVNDFSFTNKMQHQVQLFHEAFGQPVVSRPRPLPTERIGVRVELIREEFEDELIPALQAGDLVETADACIDLLYVVLGLMVECGLDAEPLFDEVHSSNMSKLGEDGKPIIAQPGDPDGTYPGRVKKGPHYFRPNLKPIIEE